MKRASPRPGSKSTLKRLDVSRTDRRRMHLFQVVARRPEVDVLVNYAASHVRY